MFDTKNVHEMLLKEAAKRDNAHEITQEKPDPLLVASKYKEEYISLLCAMYAYGNVNAIVNFLNSLDFNLLDSDESEIKTKLCDKYYRFQSVLDTQEIFTTLNKMKKISSLESIFMEGYAKKFDVMDGIFHIIETMYDINPYRSRGYEFLIGKIPKKKITSPYKRWHMFLRWMVRDDNLDFGLWRDIEKKHLLMPLDTHTFNIGKKLGLIQRKVYDFQAVLELTNSLKKLDSEDPVKFDFALYRIGQENIL
ncbi:MAG: TIGR02757 family protein [Sulfurospirillaceae bacterium]|nr:TIGR02757 family protein [Sulfurospirillaceae bacterium]